MSIKVNIQDETTGDEPHVYDWFKPTPALSEGGLAFSVIKPKEIWGQFSAASRTTAGTTQIVQPPADGSIIITDLIVNADKRNAGRVTLQLNDGTRSVVIFSASTVDAPVSSTISLGGRVRGWQNADLELVTVGAVVADVTVVYFRSEQGLEYDVWDFAR